MLAWLYLAALGITTTKGRHMSYRQGNMTIDDLGDGKARVTVTDTPSGRHLFAEVFRNNREKAAQALAGEDSKVVTVSSSDPERRIRVAGTCPSCKSPRLVLNEFGYVVCENTQCAIPAAIGETLIDPDLRCRCGKLRTDDSPECEWHDSRTEREHLGWVIVRATEAAMLRSDQDAVADLIVTVNELIEELRLNVEYVGIDVLQPWPGWGWYDVLKKHMPNFDEWLARMPSRGTAHLASELKSDDHGDINSVLATLYFVRGLVENIENPDEEHEVEAHIEQLSRIINACDRVRRGSLSRDTAPAVDEDVDGTLSPVDPSDVQIGDVVEIKTPFWRIEAECIGHPSDGYLGVRTDHDRSINVANATVRVMQSVDPDTDATPAVGEDTDDSAMLGVVSPDGGATFGEATIYPMYPHLVGDFLTLGPGIFADRNGTVINWRGENYYPRPAHPPRREDKVEEQVRRYSEEFKKAWHAADARGETGQRTKHGIRAVLDLWDDAMMGQRINVSEVEVGDYVLAYFTEVNEPQHPFSVEGYAFTTGVGKTLYVGSSRLRTADGSRSKGLGEVRMLERAKPELDPDEVEAVRQALRDAGDEELGGHWDELKVAKALVRRNVKKVHDD